MRVAFMTFACPEWDLAEVLGTAVELGYDGVEPRIDSQHRHGVEVDLSPEGRETVKRQARDAGIALCCLATSLQFIKLDAADRRLLADDARRRIELAHDLDIPGLRVFAGPVPAGVDQATAFAAAGENLRAAAEVAASAGVELWLETHDTVSRAVLTAEIVAAADHPAVQFNYDVMHPYRYGESLDDTLAALDGKIRHTHWHDAVAEPNVVEITRFGEGGLPLVDILSRLTQLGFDGYLSGEWFNQQLGATPHDSLAHYISATRELLGKAS